MDGWWSVRSVGFTPVIEGGWMEGWMDGWMVECSVGGWVIVGARRGLKLEDEDTDTRYLLGQSHTYQSAPAHTSE